MTETFVTSGDAEIFAKVTHAHDGAPWLVFSNSLMTDHTIWDAQVSQFSGRYNTLTYDQRGHGRSGLGRVTFEALSADVGTLLDHFGIEKCVYVGLSMGVPTGFGLVGKQPHRVTAMMIADGLFATRPGGQKIWQDRIAQARTNGMAWVADDTVARWFGADFIAAGGAEKLRAAAAAQSVEGYCACAEALQSYDHSQVAHGLTIPVQLVAGANDGAMPQTMQGMSEAIPNSRFEPIPNAGHIPCVEQAQRFNEILEAFLDRIKT